MLNKYVINFFQVFLHIDIFHLKFLISNQHITFFDFT